MNRLISLVAVVCLLMAGTASAQTTATVTADAPIFLNPGADRPLRVAAAGTVLRVLEEKGDWAQVEFQDPQFGRRIGWVQVQNIRILRPELKPTDLSVARNEAVAPDPQRRPPQQPTDVHRPVAAAQQALTPNLARGWLDVNLGAASAAQARVTIEERVPDFFGELEVARVRYDAPRGGSFDVGGGYWFSRHLGLGLALTGTAHKGPAEVYYERPHPNFFNRSASDTANTEDLTRAEGAVNFSLAVRAPSTGQVEFKAFAGPTFFRAEADAVDTIRYSQVWIGTANVVEILSTGTRKVDSTAWGFHAGADVGFFFSRHVGFGLSGRFSRGEVTIQDDNLIGEGPVDVKVGGTQIAGGLRIRF
jgi:hypothetical protein